MNWPTWRRRNDTAARGCPEQNAQVDATDECHRATQHPNSFAAAASPPRASYGSKSVGTQRLPCRQSAEETVARLLADLPANVTANRNLLVGRDFRSTLEKRQTLWTTQPTAARLTSPAKARGQGSFVRNRARSARGTANSAPYCRRPRHSQYPWRPMTFIVSHRGAPDDASGIRLASGSVNIGQRLFVYLETVNSVQFRRKFAICWIRPRRIDPSRQVGRGIDIGQRALRRHDDPLRVDRLGQGSHAAPAVADQS